MERLPTVAESEGMNGRLYTAGGKRIKCGVEEVAEQGKTAYGKRLL